jgi:hypothetical protein
VDTTVAIVGAGPTGLLLAGDLAQAGVAWRGAPSGLAAARDRAGLTR